MVIYPKYQVMITMQWWQYMVMSKVVKVTMSTASKPSFVQGRLQFFSPIITDAQFSIPSHHLHWQSISNFPQFSISPIFFIFLYFCYHSICNIHVLPQYLFSQHSVAKQGPTCRGEDPLGPEHHGRGKKWGGSSEKVSPKNCHLKSNMIQRDRSCSRCWLAIDGSPHHVHVSHAHHVNHAHHYNHVHASHGHHLNHAHHVHVSHVNHGHHFNHVHAPCPPCPLRPLCPRMWPLKNQVAEDNHNQAQN